jgi:hypothetical protein
VKSIVLKFCKYDREHNDNCATQKPSEKPAPSLWTEALLEALLESRKIAEAKAGATPTSHMLTRIWKRTWKAMKPEMDCDWKVIVSRYNFHFAYDREAKAEAAAAEAPARKGGRATEGNGAEQKYSKDVVQHGSAGDLEGAEDNVKGFRTWTHKAKQDLLETKMKIVSEYSDLEPGSSPFNRMLLQQFQKLHPKCMESARSIYAKVQSIEKERTKVVTVKVELGNDESGSESGRSVTEEDIMGVGEASKVFKRAESEDEDDHEEEEEEEETENIRPANEAASESNNHRTLMITKNKAAASDEAASASHIEGFEDWSLAMIRDFIACMDTARKKFAQLKEKVPEVGGGGAGPVAGGIKLVPLLLEQWKEIYPETKETVQTFLVKIKHLKLQKDIIKRHLGQSGLLPKTEDFPESTPSVPISAAANSRSKRNGGGEYGFKWNRSMIPDVVTSRKRALDIKNEALTQGKKLSFHSLWAEEFRKFHTNSTFTSNNLSVHFWSWRKHQQKLGHEDPMLEGSDMLISPPPASKKSRPAITQPPSKVFMQQHQLHPGVSAHRGPHASVWSLRSKRDLLEMGREIKARMGQHVPGFANLLHASWKKEYPGRTDTARGLNTMFYRLIKTGITGYDFEDERGKLPFRWMPSHNLALRECVAEEDARAATTSAKQQQQQQAYYTQRIVDAWKKRFPKLEVTMKAMMPRLADVVEAKSSAAEYKGRSADVQSASHTKDGVMSTAGRTQSRSASRVSSRSGSLESADDAYRRGPTSRGQMNWNQITVSDLLNAHDKVRGQTQLLRREFVTLHPHCKLSPAILLCKAYEWREKEIRGEFTRAATTALISTEHDVKSELKAEIKDEPDSNSKSSRNNNLIVFRTWSKSMIDNMVKTRRIAIEKKKKMAIGSRKSVQLLDLWYAEFTQLHPDYRCTKRNLWRKYKWYRNRTSEIGHAAKVEQEQLSAADVKMEEDAKKAVQAGNIIRIKAVRKDVFLHVKSLMEESRIFLPLKLPPEPELKQEFSLPTSPVTLPLQMMSGHQNTPNTASYFVPNVHQHQQFLQQQQPHPVQTINLDGAAPASQTLAHLHQQALQEKFRGLSPHPPRDLVTIEPAATSVSMSSLPRNFGLPAHITATAQPQEREDTQVEKKDAFKLPGGATLVAVTDRNSVGLLKPKPMEKPHVTITIGDKSKLHHQQKQDNVVVTKQQNTLPSVSGLGIMQQQHHRQQQQPIILPINVPRFPLPLQPMQNPNGAPQPLLTYVTLPANITPRAIFIPSRVKAKIDEVGLNDRDFIQLLELYEKARNEYIDTLKRGYLAFFPYVLGSIWRREVAASGGDGSIVAGRKLQAVVDLYVEEKNKGRVVTPEYLTKKPSSFPVTEELLRQILILHAEIEKNALMEAAADEDSTSGLGAPVPPNPAVLNVDMCRQWQEKYPEARMTTKQLISIHEMLNYDQHLVSDNSASPEVICALSDIWKTMDNTVPTAFMPAPEMTEEDEEPHTAAPSPTPSDPEYPLDGKDTFTLDAVQEWITRSQGISLPREKSAKHRPRHVVKNLRLFWSKDKIFDLLNCVKEAVVNRRKKVSYLERLYRRWLRRHPKSRASKAQVLGKAIWLIRQQKGKERLASERTLSIWHDACREYREAEETTHVIDEEEEERLTKLDAKDDLLLGGAAVISGEDVLTKGVPIVSRLTSLSRISSIKMASNTNRNFHNDADVLSYIAEIQQLGNKGGANNTLTWTPEVIGHLIAARRTARKRKVEWEEWAAGKFGSVGAAYLNPEAKYTKVDELFKEEWCRLRPEMSSLSVWTLVAYARRFDNLKKQLIIDNDQGHLAPSSKDTSAANEHSVPKSPWQRTLYYKNSCIPKFNLFELDKQSVSDEVKSLIRTRQLAKERQLGNPTDARASLTILWEDEWQKVHPGLPGAHLQRRLFLFECEQDKIALLKPALLRSGRIKKEDAEEEQAASSVSWENVDDELPRQRPRHSVYPDNDFTHKDDEEEGYNAVCEVTVPHPKGGHKVKKLVNLQRDYFEEPRLELPAVEKECNIIDDDYLDDEEFYFEGVEEEKGKVVMDAKSAIVRKMDVALRSYGEPEGAPFAKARFSCEFCETEYCNVNNYTYHTNLHAL